MPSNPDALSLIGFTLLVEKMLRFQQSSASFRTTAMGPAAQIYGIVFNSIKTNTDIEVPKMRMQLRLNQFKTQKRGCAPSAKICTTQIRDDMIVRRAVHARPAGVSRRHRGHLGGRGRQRLPQARHRDHRERPAGLIFHPLTNPQHGQIQQLRMGCRPQEVPHVHHGGHFTRQPRAEPRDHGMAARRGGREALQIQRFHLRGADGHAADRRQRRQGRPAHRHSQGDPCFRRSLRRPRRRSRAKGRQGQPHPQDPVAPQHPGKLPALARQFQRRHAHRLQFRRRPRTLAALPISASRCPRAWCWAAISAMR